MPRKSLVSSVSRIDRSGHSISAKCSVIAALLVVLLQATPALAADFSSYHCDNPLDGKGEADLDLLRQIEKAQAELDLQRREKKLEKLRSRSTSDLERAQVDIGLAATYFELQRSEEAVAKLEPLLDNPYLSRAQQDQIRTWLAQAASAKKDYSRVIALLAPVAKAACAPLPRAAPYLLADAFLHQPGGARDALQVLDSSSGAPDVDADWWRAAHVELRCKIDGPASCVDAVVKHAQSGGLSVELIDVFNTLLSAAIAQPAAAEAVAAAQAEGVINSSGAIVPRPAQDLEELVPIKRVAPSYPPEAVLAGVSGFVKVRIVVAPDGTVKDASVFDASPKGVFEQAALKAARKWRFKPRLIDGKPVEATGVQELRFESSR